MTDRAYRDRLLAIAGAALLAAALAYLAWKSVLSHDAESDFRFLWTAGWMWAAGADPYSDAYTAIGRQLFPGGNVIAYWLYPPQWWLICRPLAALGVDQALWAWRAVNAALLLAGGAAVVAGLRRAGRPLPAGGAMLFLALLPLCEATPQTLAMGQTSILVFLGFGLLAHALLADSTATMALALILLWLKPQFGAAVTVPLLLLPRWWKAIAIAGLVSLVLALPQLAAHGPGATLSGFLRNLARHGTLEPNQPIRLTGLTQIVVRLTGLHLSTVVAVALAAVAGVGAVAALRKRSASALGRAALALALVAVSLFFLPLHSYDFVALAVAAALAAPFGRRVRWVTWAGILVALHPAGITARLAGAASAHVALLTLAALLVLAGAVLAVIEALGRPAAYCIEGDAASPRGAAKAR